MTKPRVETPDWEAAFDAIRSRLADAEEPSVNKIAKQRRDPFRVLITTMISLRTKDAVTSASALRLFERADTPRAVAELRESEIAKLIYPAGFYRTKAANIRSCATIIAEHCNGEVPGTQADLLKLPGVGVKTANLTLNQGFGIPAICVDTHVHRISNRLGWVETGTPEKTEIALQPILPRRYWIAVNGLLVAYGKHVCTPVSPRCSTCPLSQECPKIGVTRSR